MNSTPDTGGPKSGLGATRRQLLIGAAGLGAGVLATRLGAPRVHAASHAELVEGLSERLTPAQRERIFLPWEHPSRQLVNTVAILKKPHIDTLLTADQMPYVWALWEQMQSDAGRRRFREPLRAEAGGLSGCVLIIYGDPFRGPCQSVISGGHLQLRAGDQQNGGFGDGVAYGHQVGNHQLRVPGNVWADHGDAANALFAGLTPTQQAQAVQPTKPHELVVQVQGENGTFTGVPVRTFSDAQKERFVALLGIALDAYAPKYRDQALADIGHHGGLDTLHVSYYAENGYYADGTPVDESPARRGELPYFQVWRVEGPGVVLHFEGYPHVHAYLRVARDPARQNVGSAVARTDTLLEGDVVRGFIERTMGQATGADLGVFPLKAQGRLPPGDVTEGLLWTLDPFANRVVLLEVAGGQLAPSLRKRLGSVDGRRVYRVATIDYAMHAHANKLGQWQDAHDTGIELRQMLVDELRAERVRLPTG